MKDKNRKLLTQPEQVRKGCKEYFCSLYNDPNPVENSVLDELPASGDMIVDRYPSFGTG